MSNTFDDSSRARALAARDALRQKLDPRAGKQPQPESDGGCGGYFVAANSAYDGAEAALSAGNLAKAQEKFELGLAYTAAGEACEALKWVLPTPKLLPD